MSLEHIKASFLSPPSKEDIQRKKFFGYLLGEARLRGHQTGKSLFLEISDFILTDEGVQLFYEFVCSPYVNYEYEDLMRYGHKVLDFYNK